MIFLMPAYGRIYASIADAEADWVAGKDFRILKGPYCSIRDTALFEDMGHDVVITIGNTHKIVIKGK